MNRPAWTTADWKSPRVPSAWLAGLVGLLLLAAFATSGAAQDWRLPGLEGGALASGDVAQGATIMVVWASWSPRCRDIVPRVNALSETFGGRARVVAVSFQEERAVVSDFLSGKGLRAPVYLDADGAFSKDHRVSSLPGLVIYRDGAVVYQGKLPDDPAKTIASALQ